MQCFLLDHAVRQLLGSTCVELGCLNRNCVLI